MPTLNWIGKEKIINHHNDVPFKLLKKTDSFRLENSGNFIIHGDNLMVLKSLLPKYEGLVDIVYIDPPYNTGNENWVYNDNVNDPRILKWIGEVVGPEGEDLSRHDKWLCMMYPRLKLLHKLLSPKGIVFISIDDNELCSLKMICDEIFGSNNFIANIIIENDSRARPYNSISITHEYLLMYQKSSDFVASVLTDPNKKFKYYDEQGGFDLYELRNRNSDFNIDNRPNLYYPFWVNPNKQYDNDLYEIDLEEHEGWIKFYPQESQGIKTVWRWGKPKAKENLNTVIFGRKAVGGWQVVKKYREATYSLNSVWTDSKFSSDSGTLALKKYFNNKRIFSFPKPVDLIKQCISLCPNKNAIVLDSFAGSGTTGHAVIDSNVNDGGNRKFILIEMLEYAKDITAKRIEKVIEEVENQQGILARDDLGFDFYELGEPILLEDGNLNPNISDIDTKQFIFYSETHKDLSVDCDGCFMGVNDSTAYYIFYEKEKTTCLNMKTLESVDIKADSYVIYADSCTLSKQFLEKHHIIFKKIPRDIQKI